MWKTPSQCLFKQLSSVCRHLVFDFNPILAQFIYLIEAGVRSSFLYLSETWTTIIISQVVLRTLAGTSHQVPMFIRTEFSWVAWTNWSQGGYRYAGSNSWATSLNKNTLKDQLKGLISNNVYNLKVMMQGNTILFYAEFCIHFWAIQFCIWWVQTLLV